MGEGGGVKTLTALGWEWGLMAISGLSAPFGQIGVNPPNLPPGTQTDCWVAYGMFVLSDVGQFATLSLKKNNLCV